MTHWVGFPGRDHHTDRERQFRSVVHKTSVFIERGMTETCKRRTDDDVSVVQLWSFVTG